MPNSSAPRSGKPATWEQHEDGLMLMAERAVSAALDALGCEWDDDQGKNSMRRIVGAWVEKP